jgi:hypothetical protein
VTDWDLSEEMGKTAGEKSRKKKLSGQKRNWHPLRTKLPTGIKKSPEGLTDEEQDHKHPEWKGVVDN